jgi:hypothetical protein
MAHHPPEGAMAPARRIAVALVAAFLTGSLANVAMETSVPNSLKAVRRTASGDLADLAVVTQRSVRINFGFPAALHDVARGATLVVDDARAINLNDITNLALMTVAVEEFNPDIGPRLAAVLLELADWEGEGALRQDAEETTFAIVVDEPVTDETRLRLLFFEDAALVVDERVLEAMQR